MVVTRKESKWIMVIKKEQLIVMSFALELEEEYVALDFWCIGSDYRNLFPVDGIVKKQISELEMFFG